MVTYKPDAEATAYAREAVQKAIEYLNERAHSLERRGRLDEATGVRRSVDHIHASLIGGSGCLVGAFDVRIPELLADDA